MIEEQWEEFRQNQDTALTDLNILEKSLLFGSKANMSQEHTLKLGNISMDILYNSISKSPTFIEHIKPVSPYSLQKFSVFTLICDLQLLV